jgi:hypothetical protein
LTIIGCARAERCPQAESLGRPSVPTRPRVR